MGAVGGVFLNEIGEGSAGARRVREGFDRGLEAGKVLVRTGDLRHFRNVLPRQNSVTHVLPKTAAKKSMNPHTMRTALEFEILVEELLRANRIQVSQVHGVLSGKEFDHEILLRKQVYAVQVKFYRTKRAQISLLRTAAASLIQVIENTPRFTRGMLIISAELLQKHRNQLEEDYGIVIVDRTDLFLWCANEPNLLDRLSALLEESSMSGDSSDGRAVAQIPEILPNKTKSAFDTRGTVLCNTLKELKAGKDAWPEYEHLCDQILQYLFSGELHGWHTQKRTTDGLNRFDYICRIKPLTEFWRFVIEDLESRYILFEFKNYAGLLTQGQILTTEKYLLEKALRRVAIIFSRRGAHGNAVKMAQGAMRESGKLMLVLSDEDVCEMLHMRERGDDPSDLLFEWVDDFLMALPR